MLTELDFLILQTVVQADEPVSSKRLAAVCGVAINTVRKEIDLLNEEIKVHGFSIEMKSSVGAYPVVWNEELAIPYMEQMRIFYARSRHMERTYSPRVCYLTRRCLWGGSNLSVAKLCEELYCSRSSILRELNTVRDILKEFGIELKNRRNGQGLEVIGSEWDIRQCLIFQHKLYKIGEDSGKNADFGPEYNFRSLFFMNDDGYRQVHDRLKGCLLAQREIALPVIHIPKVANLILLCVSRRKQGDTICFSPDVLAYVSATPEYSFIRDVCAGLPARFRDRLKEKEQAMAAMMLLSFGSRGSCFDGDPRWSPFLQETEELIDYLIPRFGYARDSFDRDFHLDFCQYLCQLHHRLLFGVYNDAEPIGQVRQIGLSSANLALLFARFYEKRHGVRLQQRDSMVSFYLFQRVTTQDLFCSYAQRLLVVSEFGIGTARLIAKKLSAQYGIQLACAEAREVTDLFRGDGEHWDLLVTDMSMRKATDHIPAGGLPILSIEYPFLLKNGREAKLDAYLSQVRQQAEQEIIHPDSFRRVSLGDKQAVFAYLERTLRGGAVPDEFHVAEYLEENDQLVDLERQNGVVVLPIFTARACQPQVLVLLNQEPIVWNQHKSQIFVCCVYDNSQRGRWLISSVLRRFVYMSPETKNDLLREGDQDALLILYPDE